MNLSDLMRRYTSAKVVIHYHYNTGHIDTGMISYIDDKWIELVKEKGDRMLIPVSAVRIIKFAEVVKQDRESSTLLRPSEEGDAQR